MVLDDTTCVSKGEALWADTIQFQQVIPVLRIFDVPKADEFYLGFLGFGVDWEHRFDDNAPLYRQISRTGLVLHLSEHHGDGSPGVQLRVMMQGVREFNREINEEGISVTCAGPGDDRMGARSNPASSIPLEICIRFCERIGRGGNNQSHPRRSGENRKRPRAGRVACQLTEDRESDSEPSTVEGKRMSPCGRRALTVPPQTCSAMPRRRIAGRARLDKSAIWRNPFRIATCWRRSSVEHRGVRFSIVEMSTRPVGSGLSERVGQCRSVSVRPVRDAIRQAQTFIDAIMDWAA
jgi:hypothetical protein